MFAHAADAFAIMPLAAAVFFHFHYRFPFCCRAIIFAIFDYSSMPFSFSLFMLMLIISSSLSLFFDIDAAAFRFSPFSGADWCKMPFRWFSDIAAAWCWFLRWCRHYHFLRYFRYWCCFHYVFFAAIFCFITLLLLFSPWCWWRHFSMLFFFAPFSIICFIFRFRWCRLRFFAIIDFLLRRYYEDDDAARR